MANSSRLYARAPTPDALDTFEGLVPRAPLWVPLNERRGKLCLFSSVSYCPVTSTLSTSPHSVFLLQSPVKRTAKAGLSSAPAGSVQSR